MINHFPGHLQNYTARLKVIFLLKLVKFSKLGGFSCQIKFRQVPSWATNRSVNISSYYQMMMMMRFLFVCVFVRVCGVSSGSVQYPKQRWPISPNSMHNDDYDDDVRWRWWWWWWLSDKCILFDDIFCLILLMIPVHTIESLFIPLKCFVWGQLNSISGQAFGFGR